MNSALPIVMVSALALLGISCGAGNGSSDEASPSAGSPAESPPPVNLAGAWSGTGVDSNQNTGFKGATIVTWTLAQTDTSLSGTVTTRTVEAVGTTCNSCHRNKTGTISGALAGTTMTMTLTFPAGIPGDLTPICTATITGTASNITHNTFTALYSGADSCEGPLLDGTLTMARQP